MAGENENLNIDRIPVEDMEQHRLSRALSDSLDKLGEMLTARLLPLTTALEQLAGKLQLPSAPQGPLVSAGETETTAQPATRPADLSPVLEVLNRKLTVPTIPLPSPAAAPEAAAAPGGQMVPSPLPRLEEMFRTLTSRLSPIAPKLPTLALPSPTMMGEPTGESAETRTFPIQQQQPPQAALAFLLGGLMEGLKNRLSTHVARQNIFTSGPGYDEGPKLLTGPKQEDCCEKTLKALRSIDGKLDTIIFVAKSIASALPGGFVEGGEGGGPKEKKEPKKEGWLDWWMNKALPNMGKLLTTNRPEQAATQVVGGLAGLGGPTAGLFKFGEALFATVGKLRDWGESLHQSNMQFADVSASMNAVAKEHEARQMALRNQQGEALADSARFLSEAHDRLNATFAPLESTFGRLKNNVVGFFENWLAEGLAVLQGGPTAHAADFQPEAGTSLAQFADKVSDIDWDAPWAAPFQGEGGEW